MSLGTVTVVDDQASVGPVKFTRVTVVGDGAYPAGGSTGLANALVPKVDEERTVIAVFGSGPNGDAHLEYTPKGPAKRVTAAATGDLFTSTAHGYIATDAVYFKRGHNNRANNPEQKLPGGVVEGTPYYVIASGLTANAFKVSATSGGATIDVTSNSEGDLYVEKADKLLVRVMSTGVESAVADQSGTTYSLLVVSN